jgi:AraC-like DNA-binding protein
MPYSIAPSGLRLTDFCSASDLTLASHTHSRPILALVQSGRLDQVGSGFLTPGGVRVAPAGVVHDMRLEAGTRLTIIECDPRGLAGSHPVWRRLGAALLRSPDTLGRPLRWTQAPAAHPGGGRLEVEDDILRLLSAEERLLDRRHTRPMPAELATLHDAILADPGAEFRPGALAGRLGIHRVQLGRLAREFFGRPLWHLVMSARLNQARRYLLDSSLAIARIAELSGFCDQSHLHRAFRRRFGSAPGEFRRMYQSSKTTARVPATLS